MTTLAQTIKSHINEDRLSISTMIPATVLSVENLKENKVTVQPAINMVESNGKSYPLPVIEDVTVQWQGGGGAVITLPLSVGDDVMVVFSQRSIAEFQASESGTVTPSDLRSLHMSDAYVIPCIYREANHPAPNPDDLEIRYGDSEITLMKDGAIDIFNANGSYKINADGTHKGVSKETWSMTNGTGELIDLLTQCLQTISDTTVNTYYGASPLNSKPAIDALITQLETFKE